jgi:hypothetical protein
MRYTLPALNSQGYGRMKTGQTVTDSQGVTWTVGQELGRGGVARTFVARSANGREAVLKVALTAADLFGDDADGLAKSCSQIVKDHASAMRDRKRAALPDLVGEVTTADGTAALLMPRFPATLATRLRSATPLAALLETLRRAVEACSTPHGNLRPENILLAEDGRVVLADPLTPGWLEHGARIDARLGDRKPARPPEATTDLIAGWDAYALCIALFQASMCDPATLESRREDLTPAPTAGLDKSTLARLKDRILARLDHEQANPRFATRAADKLCALLNRGLSLQASPSPPYRFDSTSDLLARLTEIVELVDPKVHAVGKVMLAAGARDNVFGEGMVASFSTTVTVSEGISHEDLAAGLLVRDLDADGDDRVPVPDAQFTVKPHPSGRLRFDFTLPELRPGRYTVRIAFAVKDSRHEPTTTDGHFELRPPPGYVPPAEDTSTVAAPIPFPGAASRRGSADLDQPRYTPDHDDAAFPSPIAPSDPGSLEDLDDAPPPVLQAAGSPLSGGALQTPPTLEPLPSISPSESRATDPEAHDRTAEAPSAGASHSGSPASWSGPGTWERLPEPDPIPDPIGLDHDVGLGDLPSLDGGLPSQANPFAEIVEKFKDNPWIAMGALVASLVLMLVVLGLVFQSCGS